MKTWLAWTLAGLMAFAAFIASGPFRTMYAIRDAVRANDAAALSGQVDFPAVRASLKAQLSDRLVRSAGADLQSNLLAAIGIRVADSVIGASVDTMITPLGLGAIMEGRREWAHARDGFQAPSANAAQPDLLRGAAYRFESPSRFTATVHDAQGSPAVFVVTRDGIHWRLSDIRLPP
jgi:hypothetical protein